MNKSFQLTFFKSEFAQFNYILDDEPIRNKIANFVFKYVSVEAFYKKLLVAEREKAGKKLSKKERNLLDVNIPEVKRVLDYYEIQYDADLIERIFGSNDKNYMECSIKKLRNRLVHNVNDNVLRVVIERYDSMISDLDEFVSMFSHFNY